MTHCYQVCVCVCVRVCAHGVRKQRKKQNGAPPFPKSARSFDRSLMTQSCRPWEKPPKHAKTPPQDGPLLAINGVITTINDLING